MADENLPDFHDIDGWAEFLEARMRVIKSAVSKGYRPSELEELVNISGMQTQLLRMQAIKENQGA